MNTSFYRALEDKFRGTREEIKSRLKVYQPFIAPLKTIYPEAEALDLRCGRGEWLELVTELGFLAQGVDLDEHMLEASRALGYTVHGGDAVSFIKKLPDESQTIITAFHLVEHLAFIDLQTIVEEALRALRPGGLLIMETPNPESLIVGTADFYLDPTHRHPIPPKLLGFLPEYYGFEQAKVVRLQEPTTISEDLSLLNVFEGVSQDYAVIAQKSGPVELMRSIHAAFSVEYGVTLEQIATAYSKQHDINNAKALQNELDEVKSQLQQLTCTLKNNQSTVNQPVQSQKLNNDLKAVNTELEKTVSNLKRIWVKSAKTDAQISTIEINQSKEKLFSLKLKHDHDATRQSLSQIIAELKTARNHEHKILTQITHLQDAWKAVSAKKPIAHHSVATPDEVNHLLQTIYTSTSWKITRPLRKTMLIIEKGLQIIHLGLHNCKQSLKFNRSNKTEIKSSQQPTTELDEPPNLSPYAAVIYSKLKSAYEMRKN